MNKSELITELRGKFYEVDEDGIHEGNTEAGITVWGIGVFEKIGDAVVRKLNLTFYTKGDEAFWGISEPNPSIPTPDTTFEDRVNVFIASKINDGMIKFGYIEQISGITKKAMGTAIMSVDNTEKKVIATEDAEGVFSIEIL